MTMKFILFLFSSYLHCVCSQNNFYSSFLKWQLKHRQKMDFDKCLALNFGFGSSLEIPTFSMQAPEVQIDQNQTEKLPLNREIFTSASESCLLVFIGKYFLEKIDEISEQVKQLSREARTRPTAFFVNTEQKDKVISTEVLYYPLVSDKVSL